MKAWELTKTSLILSPSSPAPANLSSLLYGPETHKLSFLNLEPFLSDIEPTHLAHGIFREIAFSETKIISTESEITKSLELEC